MSNNQEFKPGDFAWYWAFDKNVDEARCVLIVSLYKGNNYAEALDLTDNKKRMLNCSTLGKTKEEIEYAMDNPLEAWITR